MSWGVQELATSRPPDFNLSCPQCGPNRKDPANRQRKVLGVWEQADGTEVQWCIRCGWSEHSPRAHRGEEVSRRYTQNQDRSNVAAVLWARRLPIEGTPAETYLRDGRGLTCPLPQTIGYLPAYKDYPHAMIAAFGLCEEPVPGVLAPPAIIRAVHLTELAADGRSRTAKRMLGQVSGHPLVLAPPNDAQGLVVAEGIEDALSLHEVTGLGAWAGGSACHMAKLGPVVPDYIDCVSIAEDTNPAGQQATTALAAELRMRGLNVLVIRFQG